MKEMVQDYITPFIYLLQEMAPFLLLGFLVAGILHAFVPQSVYHKWLSGNDVKSILLSLLFGIPLPLCSCGVIPTAVSMRKEGASKAATTAFLIGTPQTGVDSIAATWSVLGLPFAILRPVVALVTGFFGGLMAGKVERGENSSDTTCEDGDSCECRSSVPTNLPFADRCKEALKYGFTDMIQDIGKWLVIGLLLAGLITIFVPDNFFTAYAGHGILNMVLVLVIAVPMYVCATGSIPIAAALMVKGLSPGAALVFLMAGPATNLASMMVLGKTLGKKSLLAYLVSIIGGALIFGIAVDAFLPAGWFSSSVTETFESSCCHTDMQEATPWWQVASSIALVVLLVRAWVLRIRQSKIETKTKNMAKTFVVKGMVCNHCKANVERTISAIEGVTSVVVDLSTGKAIVEGEVSAEKVISAVTAVGYECSQE